MNLNFLVVLSTALIPIIVGFVWYNPKVMGTIWMPEKQFNQYHLWLRNT